MGIRLHGLKDQRSGGLGTAGRSLRRLRGPRLGANHLSRVAKKALPSRARKRPNCRWDGSCMAESSAVPTRNGSQGPNKEPAALSGLLQRARVDRDAGVPVQDLRSRRLSVGAGGLESVLAYRLSFWTKASSCRVLGFWLFVNNPGVLAQYPMSVPESSKLICKHTTTISAYMSDCPPNQHQQPGQFGSL